MLTELFWDDERCVRFGVADRQQGASETAAWRAAHPTVPAGRHLRDTRVLAIDDRPPDGGSRCITSWSRWAPSSNVTR